MAGRENRDGYKEWLNPEGLKLLNQWCKLGYTDKQIAEKIGVTPRTIYYWKNRYPEIKEAMSHGKIDFDIMMTEELLKRGQGQYVKEKKVIVEKDPKGGEPRQRVEESERYIPADVTAIIFWLKNRHPDLWRNTSTEFRNKMVAETEKLKAETKKLELDSAVNESVEDGLSKLINLIQEEVGGLDESESDLHG